MNNRQAAIEIIQQLQQHGFQALLAGGCVRDMLLGRTANDYDVATNAQPADVMRLFRRTLKVGAKFGVVIVLIRKQQVEVATFRAEAGYEDGRHPTEVRFTSAAEDASRRDFTINGMFYDPLSDQVIDYVEGRADLKKRIVRTIGNPEERFGEDYLRMLRAVRFSTQLGFAIEPATYAAIGRNAAKITRISGERVAAELEGMLVHPNRAAGAAMLIETGLAEAVFPGFAGEPAQRGVTVLGRLRKNVDSRWPCPRSSSAILRVSSQPDANCSSSATSRASTSSSSSFIAARCWIRRCPSRGSRSSWRLPASGTSTNWNGPSRKPPRRRRAWRIWPRCASVSEIWATSMSSPSPC